MGFAGSGASATVILFAGLPELLAGALSIAAGEYISMRSQREAYQREITLEEQELRDEAEAEAEARLPQFVGTFRGSAERLCW